MHFSIPQQKEEIIQLVRKYHNYEQMSLTILSKDIGNHNLVNKPFF